MSVGEVATRRRSPFGTNVTPGEDGYVCVHGARTADVLRTWFMR
jgi:hypothetical protein